MHVKLPNWSYMLKNILSVIFKFFTITISIIWKYPLPTLVISRLDLDSCPKFSKFGYQNLRLRKNPSKNLLLYFGENGSDMAPDGPMELVCPVVGSKQPICSISITLSASDTARALPAYLQTALTSGQAPCWSNGIGMFRCG